MDFNEAMEHEYDADALPWAATVLALRVAADTFQADKTPTTLFTLGMATGAYVSATIDAGAKGFDPPFERLDPALLPLLHAAHGVLADSGATLDTKVQAVVDAALALPVGDDKGATS